MDAPCEIQRSIHVFRLVNNMCPGKWVHIIRIAFLHYMYLTTLIMDFLCNITDDFWCRSAAATNNFSPRLTPYIYVVYKGC